MEEARYHIDDTSWKIWIVYYDMNGKVVGFGQYRFTYTHKSSAVRRAKQLWGDNPMVKWTVSKTNPWTGDSEANRDV